MVKKQNFLEGEKLTVCALQLDAHAVFEVEWRGAVNTVRRARAGAAVRSARLARALQRVVVRLRAALYTLAAEQVVLHSEPICRQLHTNEIHVNETAE